MTDPTSVVRPVTAHEVSAAADVLANAFADNPLFGFILDGRDDIKRRLHHLFRDAAEAELRNQTHLVERRYARFGFESRGSIPLPTGAPVVTAMWRDAQPPNPQRETS